MKELIKVEPNSFNGRNINSVNARDLHSFLGSKRDFSSWVKSRISKYNFVSGVDFIICENLSSPKLGSSKARPQKTIEYHLTLDMAKEISMVERNEKGKQARQYFIECERIAKDPVARLVAAPKSEALLLAAELAKKVEEQQEQLQLQAPKVLFADSVSTSDDLILIRDLAKILNQNGVKIGGNRLFEWLRENGYLIKQAGTDRNRPTQRAINLGLFKIKETAVTHSSGQVRVNITPKVTGKGQTYFINKFLGEA